MEGENNGATYSGKQFSQGQFWMNTVVRTEKRDKKALTDRAQAAAQNAGFGVWDRSLRVNRHHDRVWMITGLVAVFVAPLPFLAAGFCLSGPWWGKLLSLSVGLAVLAFGLFVSAGVAAQIMSGTGLAHFFETGLVLERTKGEMHASHYDEVSVDYVTWTESTNDAPRKQIRLWVKMAESRVVMLDAGNAAEHANASWIAMRLGLSPTPQTIEEPRHMHPMW
ncbi:hypothetical protein HGG72_16755 [Ochrobactrum pecoris]|uniref:Uncharacterized protein n=1 Tax=Brucella pecoris TaxID=867683 RepID=A0A5C5CCD5_9HYPH|nr:hypothetical protein [Brucella pecoris]MBB4096024.1 hypothetical protein [Brucella pecoris]NKW81582.1 hypothetical protein [Brucella pecoris]TNV08947.1 hypothetical protein FIB18_22570 [Brucella pecoris]